MNFNVEYPILNTECRSLERTSELVPIAIGIGRSIFKIQFQGILGQGTLPRHCLRFDSDQYDTTIQP